MTEESKVALFASLAGLGLAVALTVPSFIDDTYDERPSGSNSETESKQVASNYQDQELLDDNGNKYTLHKNQDGSETARYEDGKEVTFKRDEQGNINHQSGDSSLLPGLLMGYLLFSGLSSSGGTWNSAGNYVPNAPMKPISQEERKSRMLNYVPAGSKIQDITPPQNNGSSGSGFAKGSGSSNGTKSSVGNVKSGFGSAGARSAAS